MTKQQRKMLEVLDWWGGHGTIEATIQYGEFDSGSESQSWHRSVLAASSVVRALVRRGWATDGEWGWDITEAGRDVLRRSGYMCREERLAQQQSEGVQ